ncbi:MAG: hypothetical protein WEF53_01660 [Bacteroidota bacterium]
MFSAIELRKPNGRLAAVIISTNGRAAVTFAESERLLNFLDNLVSKGIDIEIPRGTEWIEINAKPGNPDFLENLMRYLNLSYDFVCSYTRVIPDLPIQAAFSSAVKALKGAGHGLLFFGLEWGQKNPAHQQSILPSESMPTLKVEMGSEWATE